MKKIIILVLVVALTVGVLPLWHYLKANKATPEEVFNEYVRQFSQQNYEEMLKLIAEGDLETYDYSKRVLPKSIMRFFRVLRLLQLKFYPKSCFTKMIARRIKESSR